MLKKIIGEFSWQAPIWLRACGRRVCKWYIGLPMLLFIMIVAGVTYWYFQRPVTPAVQWHIQIPKLPLAKNNQKPTPLLIRFQQQGNEKSVAPLALIGKDIHQGITVSPAIKGQWHWLSSSRLQFLPEKPWPAGSKYSVSLSRQLLSDDTRLLDYRQSFTTTPLQLSIAKLVFNVDEKDPRKKTLIADIRSNYRLQTEDFSQKVSLHFIDDQGKAGDTIAFHQKFDKYQQQVYLRSDNLSLPASDRFALLRLNKGIKPESGQAIEKSLQQSVKIPAINSLLKIQKIDSSVLRNSQNIPEKVLLISANLPIAQKQLAAAVHVYELPSNYQGQSNYVWSLPGQIGDDVLRASKQLTLTPIPGKHSFAKTHGFQYQAGSNRYLFITIDNKLTALGGFYLSTPYRTIVATSAYPKELAFYRQGSLLSSRDKKRISLQTRGLSAVRFTTSRIIQADLNHFVSQTGGDFTSPYFANYQFDASNMSQVYRKTVRLNAQQKQQLQYPSLSLDDYLRHQQHSLGLFYIRAQGWDVARQQTTTSAINRVVLVTNMALIDKVNVDGSRDLFVQAIDSGKPVDAAQVKVLGKNGVAIFQAKTDQQGHLHIPELNQFTDEKQPIAIVVNKVDDVSFIPINRYDRYLNYSRFSVGGVTYLPQMANRLQAYIYTNQTIYRPGDKVHMGFVVKAADWAGGQRIDTKDVPVELIITDPQGKTLLDKSVALNADGFFDQSYATNQWSMVGTYQVNLYVKKDSKTNSLLGSSFFQVTDFSPDRLRIHAKFNRSSQQAWLKPSQLHASVDLQNLFGKPAIDHKITATLDLSPSAFQFQQYPQYQFFDPLYDSDKPSKAVQASLPDKTTNNNGVVDFDLGLQQYPSATYRLNLAIQGFEKAGGRSVSTALNRLISPLDYLLGINTAGTLNFIKPNAERHIELIVVNQQLQKIALTGVQLKTYEKQQQSVLTQKPDGSYQYQTTSQRQLRNTKTIDLAANANKIKLFTNKPGDYVLVLEDKHGNLLGQVDYNVVGEGALFVNKHAQLVLNLDKKTYQPGASMQLSIRAPYAGTGLITIESDNVKYFKWVHSDTSNSVTSIQLPKTLTTDAYVSVMWMRNWQDKQGLIDPLSYAVLPFHIDHQQHNMDIQLHVPKQVKSGERLTIHYQAKHPGKIILFGVNEGVLQVANYLSPDPLAYFFRKQALGVRTAQTADLVMPRYQSPQHSAPGGGMNAMVRMKSNEANPFSLQINQPVVFWSGVKQVTQQQQTFTYTVPDWFNGELRIMAVAVGGQQMGAAQQSVVARNDFIITPSVPNVVAPGDRFTLAVSVNNNLQHQTEATAIDVKLTSDQQQLQIIGKQQQQLSLAANTEKTLLFTLQAQSLLGAARLKITASGAGKQSQLTQVVSIRPDVAYSTEVNSGIAQGSKTLTLANNQAIYADGRQLRVSASYNPLVLASGLLDSLRIKADNSDFFTDDVVSRLVALSTAFDGFTIDQQKITADLNVLRQRQTSEGDFTWFDKWLPTPSVSIYTLDVLTTLQQQGYAAPRGMLEQGIHYLKNLANQPSKNLQQAKWQAYAIFVLARNQIVSSDALAQLQHYLSQQKDWQQGYIALYMAASYQLFQQNQMAEKLLKQFTHSDKTGARQADYLRIVANYFPSLAKQLSVDEQQQLLTPITDTQQFSPVTAAKWIVALQAYAKRRPVSTQKVMIKQQLADGKLANLANTMNANFSANATQLQFIGDAKTPFFYQITRAGYNPNFYQQHAANNTEVFQSIVDEHGNPLTQLAVGQQAEMIIRLRPKAGQSPDYFSIIALLPAGFSVQQQPMRITNPYYQIVRDDRVLFVVPAQGSQAISLRYKITAINPGHYNVPAVAVIAHDSQNALRSYDYGKASTITVK